MAKQELESISVCFMFQKAVPGIFPSVHSVYDGTCAANHLWKHLTQQRWEANGKAEMQRFNWAVFGHRRMSRVGQGLEGLKAS